MAVATTAKHYCLRQLYTIMLRWLLTYCILRRVGWGQLTTAFVTVVREGG